MHHTQFFRLLKFLLLYKVSDRWTVSHLFCSVYWTFCEQKTFCLCTNCFVFLFCWSIWNRLLNKKNILKLEFLAIRCSVIYEVISPIPNALLEFNSIHPTLVERKKCRKINVENTGETFLALTLIFVFDQSRIHLASLM
jgi:hypothetical protein